MSNYRNAVHPEKIVSLSDETTQIIDNINTNNINNINLKDNNTFSEIVKELYDSYNEK
ncbi:4358_t:CDS:1, partial [Cetraspora pellucida]